MDLKSLQGDLNAYLAAVLVETDGPPRPFAAVADGWQQQDIRTIAPAVQRLVREDGPDPPCCRCWWVRPRGHSKTADAAMLVAWVLAFSRRRRRMVWVAADKDQGCEGLDSIKTLCRHNPWLDMLLTCRTDKVENLHTESVVHFATSDVLSAFGWKDCDLFVMDEVTHWGPRGEELWAAMYSAAGKRRRAVVFALMNAGHADTWQRNLRDKAEHDPRWAFSELPNAVASWITADRLADQAKYLPKIAYQRLWLNQWSLGSGDALSEDDIQASITQPGPLPGPEPGWVYFAGVDLGLSRDASALAVVGLHVGHAEEIAREEPEIRAPAAVDLGYLDEPDAAPEEVFHEGTGRLRLVRLKLWTPGKAKVQIEQVEAAIVRADKLYFLQAVGCDPWQASYLIERLTKLGLPCEAVEFTSNNLKSMCTATLESFTERRIDLYQYPQLVADLRALRVEEKSYGVRLVPGKTERGTKHGDAATALAVALHLARTKPFSLHVLDHELIVE